MRIRKPRIKADEAIRPPRVEERSSRPRRRPHIRALPVAAFGPTHTRAEPKPGGMGLAGRSAVSRRSPMGAYHWLRVASCISSRKASVAATRDLFRGSLTHTGFFFMPQKKHPLSVEDLWAIRRLGSPTIAPDGRYACASVTAYDMERNEGRTELWLFPTDGSKARPLTA